MITSPTDARRRPLQADSSVELLLAASAAESELPLDAALEQIGITRFHAALALAAACGWAADNAWISCVVLITPRLAAEFSSPRALDGLYLTTLWCGQAAGALLWGPFSDVYGRKPAFVLTLGLAGLCGGGVALAPTYATLLAALFLTGVAVGGNMPVDGALLAEFLPPSRRGRWMVALSVSWSLGGFLLSLLAWSLIPRLSCDGAAACNAGWRLTVGALAALNLAATASRRGLPESPAFLLARGRADEAHAVLLRVAGTPPPLGLQLLPHAAAELPWRDATRRLLREMPLTLLLLAAIWFFANLGYGVFNSSVPKLLAAKGIGAAKAGEAAVYRDALIYAAAGVPGSLAGMLLVDSCLGRKWSLAGSALALGAGLAAFALVQSEAAAVGASCLINAAAQAMYAAQFLYTPEVLPTAVRASGVALLSAISRVSGTIAPLVAGALLHATGDSQLLLYIGAGCLGLVVLATGCLPIETKGRALK
ncbi:hypothetical protein AB1Y20_002604 [Prymnesium parvum]|uniref:Major facilitator superfamily (MFS) profile domain-containing protein n=1 Tax=Prymnesium parvum TaxID=97485 RepID=A0AB34JBB5_PRYPA